MKLMISWLALTGSPRRCPERSGTAGLSSGRPIDAVLGDELRQQPVYDYRVAAMGPMASPLDRDERAAGQLGEGHPGGIRPDRIFVAVDDEHRLAHAFTHRPGVLRAASI